MKKLVLALLGCALLFSCQKPTNHYIAPTANNTPTPTPSTDNDDQVPIAFYANGGTFADGKPTKEMMVDKGTMPKVENPTKIDPEGRGVYKFKAWSPSISVALEPAVYVASYTYVDNAYTVKWYDDQKKILETDEKVPYGTAPTFNGKLPTYPDKFFDHWEDSNHQPLHAVTADVDYYPVYLPNPTPLCSYGIFCLNNIVIIDGIGVFDKYYVSQAKLNTEIKLTFYPVIDPTGEYTYTLPDTVDITVDEQPMSEKDYTYDPTTGSLTFKVVGNNIRVGGFSRPVHPQVRLTYSSTKANNPVKINYTQLDKSAPPPAFHWGDDSKVSPDGSHTYTEPGEYEIVIKGAVNKIALADKDGLLAAGNVDITSVVYESSMMFGSGEKPGVDDYAFAGCEKLESVTLPVTDKEKSGTIGYNAFKGCAALKSINIPQNINDIKLDAFVGCSSLHRIFVHPDNETFTSRDKDNKECNIIARKDASKQTTELLAACNNLDYGRFDGNIKLDDNVFHASSYVSDVMLDNRVTSLGMGAFAGCKNLTAVNKTADSPLTEYPNNVCMDCSSLTYVDFVNIKKIGASAFANCDSLHQVSFPICLEEILADAFYYTPLDFIDLSRVGEPAKDSGNPYKIPTIADNSFYLKTEAGPRDVTVLTPSGKQTSISGEYEARQAYENMGCFKDTDALFKLLDGHEYCKLVSWGDISVAPGTSEEARTICFHATLPKDYVQEYTEFTVDWGDGSDPVPIKLDKVDNEFKYTYAEVSEETSYRFRIYSLNLVVMSNNYYCLGDVSFNKVTETPHAHSLYAPGNAKITSFYNPHPYHTDGEWYTPLAIPDYAFAGMSSLSKILLSSHTMAKAGADNVTIGAGAFQDDENLTSFAVPSGVTALGDSCFKDCHKLSNIIFNAELTAIGDRAFADCSTLATVNFTRRLGQIGEEGFYGCRALKNVNLFNYDYNNQHVVSLKRNAFAIAGRDYRVYVMNEYLKDYQDSVQWEPYKNYLAGI